MMSWLFWSAALFSPADTNTPFKNSQLNSSSTLNFSIVLNHSYRYFPLKSLICCFMLWENLAKIILRFFRDFSFKIKKIDYCPPSSVLVSIFFTPSSSGVRQIPRASPRTRRAPPSAPSAGAVRPIPSIAAAAAAALRHQRRLPLLLLLLLRW